MLQSFSCARHVACVATVFGEALRVNKSLRILKLGNIPICYNGECVQVSPLPGLSPTAGRVPQAS